MDDDNSKLFITKKKVSLNDLSAESTVADVDDLKLSAGILV